MLFSVGIATLLIAGVAAYGISTVSTQVLDKPQSDMPDYSDELQSLNSQVKAIKSDLVVLNDLKTDIYQIKQKLIALEKKGTIENISLLRKDLAIDLDKSIYSPGDTIKIAAEGIEPQKMVNIQLLDVDDFILINKQAWSDSAGKILYQLKLSNALPTGNYELRLISDEKTVSEQIRVKTVIQDTDTISVDQYTFTVQTDKSIYQRGELIEVTGTGKPNSPVSATLTSPSGKTFSANSSTQANGKFTMFFSTSSNFEEGKWYITANHVSKTIVVSVIID